MSGPARITPDCPVQPLMASVLALVLLGSCHPSDAPRVAPARGSAPEVGIAPPEQPSKAAAASSASATAATPADASAAAAAPGSGTAAAAPIAPPPACPTRAARRPAGFAAGATASGLVFTSVDHEAVAALQRIQRRIDQWSQRNGLGACHVSRSDGELLVVFCTAAFTTGNGSLRPGPSEAFSYHRARRDWKPIRLPQMLPGAGPDPRPALQRRCSHTALSHLAELPLQEPASGDGWLNGVEPWRDGLNVEAGWRTEPGGSASCLIPWPQLGPELGCGPLAHLLRPQLLEPSALVTHPAGPLEVARVYAPELEANSYYPYFTSRDPRRAAVAQELNAGIAVWWRKEVKGQHYNVRCNVTLSNQDLVSVLCEAGDGGDPPQLESFIYRLGDGQRVTVAQLVGAKPKALQRIAARCLSGQVRQPQGDYDEFLPKLPRLSAADVALGLELGRVQVVVRYEAHTTAEPHRIVRHRTCWVTYGDLNTTPRAIAAVP